MLGRLIKDKKTRKAAGFILRFLLVYFGLSFLYYLYHRLVFPDTVFLTDIAAWQSKHLLLWLGEPVSTISANTYPKIFVLRDGVSIVAIYEGCNAASLYIVFLAFIFSFFLFKMRLLGYVLISAVIVNFANVLRIVALYFISLHQPQNMYFYHKYVFNGLLFILVIGLWFFAVKKYHAFRR